MKWLPRRGWPSGAPKPCAKYGPALQAAEKLDLSPECRRLKPTRRRKISDLDAGLKAGSTRSWLVRELFSSLLSRWGRRLDLNGTSLSQATPA
jgi:hypothetical protein